MMDMQVNFVGFAERNQKGSFYSGIFYKLFNYLLFGLSRHLLSVFHCFSRKEKDTSSFAVCRQTLNECSSRKHLLICSKDKRKLFWELLACGVSRVT